MNIDQVIKKFETEFGVKADCFSILELSVEEANVTMDPRANRPGAYVYWHPRYDVVLVGKSRASPTQGRERFNISRIIPGMMS